MGIPPGACSNCIHAVFTAVNCNRTFASYRHTVLKIAKRILGVLTSDSSLLTGSLTQHYLRMVGYMRGVRESKTAVNQDAHIVLRHHTNVPR